MVLAHVATRLGETLTTGEIVRWADARRGDGQMIERLRWGRCSEGGNVEMGRLSDGGES